MIARLAIVLSVAAAVAVTALVSDAYAGSPAGPRDNPLRDGKYLPQPKGAYGISYGRTASAGPASFHWEDAGVGAGTALGAVLVTCGALLVLRRQGRFAV